MLFAGARPTAGRRVAVVTTTGGAAAMVVDRLGTLGADLMPAPPALIQRLLAEGLHVHEGPIIDLTAAGTRKETYQMALDELTASADCDAIIAVIGSSGMSHPEHAVEPIVTARRGDKPIAVFIAPEAPHTLDLLMTVGVAAFRTPEACADSVAALLNWRAPRPPIAIEDNAVLEAAFETAFEAAGGSMVDELASRAVFDALGIKSADAELITAPEHAVGVSFPVVAKVVSPDIAHKTDAGGVCLGLTDAAALSRAITEILAAVGKSMPDARIHGILVQEMHSGLGEAIIGFRRDSEVGPLVVIGVGGTLAEIYRDVSVRIAPVNEAEAMEMIAEVRGLAPLRGYRGAPCGDVVALAQAVVGLSRLAAYPRVQEAEINPLIVKRAGEGVIAVDGLLVAGNGGA